MQEVVDRLMSCSCNNALRGSEYNAVNERLSHPGTREVGTASALGLQLDPEENGDTGRLLDAGKPAAHLGRRSAERPTDSVTTLTSRHILWDCRRPCRAPT